MSRAEGSPGDDSACAQPHQWTAGIPKFLESHGGGDSTPLKACAAQLRHRSSSATWADKYDDGIRDETSLCVLSRILVSAMPYEDFS